MADNVAAAKSVEDKKVEILNISDLLNGLQISHNQKLERKRIIKLDIKYFENKLIGDSYLIQQKLKFVEYQKSK